MLNIEADNLLKSKMPSAIFYALFVALVAGICSSQQECLFPTNDDLVQVISEIFRTGDSPTPPTVTLLRFHPVCLAFGRQQDRYRLVSIVVEYTCSGNTNCPSGTVVEQIESQCNDGVWSNVVLGSTENTRLVTPDADFSTTTREDCSLCLSPELANSVVGVTTDNVTHCLGKCITGYDCMSKLTIAYLTFCSPLVPSL